MIAWGILWIILLFITILLFAMESINGSLEWRFWLCIILGLIIIMIPAFGIQELNRTINFYNEYTLLYDEINSKNLSMEQEYSILGQVINYNHTLYMYQSKFDKFGIFAPVYWKVKNLSSIQLTYFDVNKYRFWE